MPQDMRRISLKWKIGGVFTCVMLIVGLSVVAAVYELTRNALREQLEQRVLTIAANLRDAAAGYLTQRNSLALHALASKVTLLDGVAYAFIEDGKGEILAHTFGTFPVELRQSPNEGSRQISRRELSLGGKPVYETSAPVLGGQIGVVRVGFWGESIENEIKRALLPLLETVAIISLIGAVLSFFLGGWIVSPLVGLTKIADKVTMGDLETSVSGRCVKSRDEIGELARALERMRSSLKAAMLRLGRETA